MSTGAKSHDRNDEQKGMQGMNRTRGLCRRTLIAVLGCLTMAAALAPGASANLEFLKTGVQLIEPNGTYSRQAGAHPDFTFEFSLPKVQNSNGQLVPTEAVRDVDLDLPPGFVGNPTSFLECTPAQLFNGAQGAPACPVESQIGTARVYAGGQTPLVALYNLTHGPEVPARFGFQYLGALATITPRVRPTDYGISSGSFSISQLLPIELVKVRLWGVPADTRHDTERQPFGAAALTSDTTSEESAFGPLPTEAPRVPFFTNPTSCPEAALSFIARGDSWEHPDVFDVKQITADEEGTPFVFEGCENVPFEPTMTAAPGTHRAHSPTGLDVNIDLPSNEGPKGYSAANVKKTVISFPQGMSVSASAVAGLGACSEAQVGLGNNNPPTCPDSSKIGNVTIGTQVLPDPVEGEVVLATQNTNPFGSTYAVYLLAKGPGFYLKLPGELKLDKQNGQLQAIFSNLPQLPFENVHLDFRGGPTAPLVTPDTCGDYSIRTEVTSWASETPVIAEVPMKIDEDCAGGGKFNPTLQAGVANPVAGAESPLTLRIRRQDGEQNISRLDVTLPEGELAKLKGVELCPEALTASAACGPKSQVGISTTAIGTGAFPLFVPQPGKAPTALYLAGPYKGAPYSLITKVPAQSGPFDFGNIVVRTAINVDPVTTQVIAKSDPLPQILEGVPISYRDVRIEVQKPDFTVNPTSCEQREVTSTIYSTQGATAHPSVPAKVGDCASLNFAPKLAFSLKGGTNRGDFQALTATLTTGKHEANIAKVAVTLPHSEFLEQSHIGTVCTRVQFAAKKCPEASIYGYAKATTPLLDTPLEGPVYLRSSNNPLPDMVAALNGQFNVELAGRIDSVNGGIRNRFEVVPDAPVSKFTLKLKGGAKSLLVNSRNLCKSVSKAEVKMVGQNGMTHSERPVVRNSCGKKAKKKAARAKQRRG
jgi:hypothetical protein